MMVPSGDGDGPQYSGEWRDGYELSIALARAGAEVTLLSPSIGKFEKDVRANIDAVALAGGVKLKYAPFVLNRRSGDYMSVRLTIAWIMEYLRARPSLVIFKQIRPDPGLLIPGIKKKCIALTCQLPSVKNAVYAQSENTGLLYRQPSVFERAMKYLCEKIIMLYSMVRDPYEQYRAIGLLVQPGDEAGENACRVAGHETLLMPKGILSYKFIEDECASQQKDIDAVYCGAITYNKCVFELVDAWKRLPVKAKLVIIGAGAPELQEKLAAAIKGFPEIEYRGALHFFDKFRLLSRAKIFILPSRKDFNPSAILEALSMGVPVITSRQITSPVQHGYNGLLSDAGDINGLSQNIAFLLAHDDERKKMADNARESAGRYSWQKAVDAVSSLVGGLPRAHRDYPVNICLSVSAACQAKCIFCPPERGKRITPKFMAYELFRKIIENAKNDSFEGTFIFGENGEPLLNPDFNKMIVFTRSLFPKNRIILFSNMERLSPETAEVILNNGVNEIHFNYDGATAETYTYVKGLDFARVTENIRHFLQRRNSGGFTTKVHVQIISANRYLKTMGLPQAAKFKDDSKEAAAAWKGYLSPHDTVSFTPIAQWAMDARRMTAKKTPCGMLPRIGKNIYVAPSGKTYICCMDANADLVYGDLSTQIIRDAWQSPSREKMVDSLMENDFASLGFPCTVCRE